MSVYKFCQNPDHAIRIWNGEVTTCECGFPVGDGDPVVFVRVRPFVETCTHVHPHTQVERPCSGGIASVCIGCGQEVV